MKKALTVALVIVVAAVCQHCLAQGFMNLNFENARVVYVSPPAIIDASNAIPRWSAYVGPPDNPTNSSSIGLSAIFYNGVSIGGAIVSLEDTNAVFGPLPIQGTYSVLLEGSSLAAATTASIGQIGTIPTNAQSIVFWGVAGGLQISFNGQPLSYTVTGSTPNYSIFGVDISAFAGQTGQLLFTASVQGSALLDNIQFSNQMVPEPGVFALAALGFISLFIRRRK
jgi:hypothetical protein